MSQSPYERVTLSDLVKEKTLPYGIQTMWTTEKRSDTLVKANIVTLTELLFVLLPIIAMIIIFASQGDPLKVFQQAEWSFAAAVLAGQSIVKVATAVTLYDEAVRDRDWAAEARRRTLVRLSYIFGLIVAAEVVFLLVPSLIFLSLMLILSPIPFWLPIAQILLFLGATLAYASLNARIARIKEREPQTDLFALEPDEVS